MVLDDDTIPSAPFLMTNYSTISNKIDLPASTPVARHLAKRLAAYLPTTLTRQVISGELPQPGEVRWIQAATLFADISGFTAMAEALAAQGPRGAETLNRTLLMTFTALINAIHDAGGAVSHFHGDAMMVYFLDTDGRSAQRALGCARFMQSLMLTSFSSVSSAIKQPFSLTMRIGLGYGRCLETVVGDAEQTMEFVLAGPAVDEAVAAEHQATAGQVVASASVLQQAGLPVPDLFRVVEEVLPVPSAGAPFYWESFDQTALNSVIQIAAAFVPPALFLRLQDADNQFVAENRPVTSMFVRFEGIDFMDDDSGAQLQAYYQWAWQVVTQFGGDNSRVNRVLTGDKGSHLHIIFGAPVAPDAPAQAIRCALALQNGRPDFITKQQIGLAAGRVFACAVGSQNRREYTTVGSVVNLSSRLTALCPDGAVLIDETTAARVAEQFAFETVPDVAVKGFAQPIMLFQPVREKSVQARSRFSQPQPIPLGRRVEMAQLNGRLAAARQGEGGVVALVGPFGSGQSQMLTTAVLDWLAADGRVASGICQQQLGEVSFAPWQTVWRELLHIVPEMSVAEVETAVAETITAYLPPDEYDASLLGDLLGLAHLASATAQAEPVERRQQRLFDLAGKLLMALAQPQPLLLVLEDVHWADQLSLDLLGSLAEVLASSPILLLLTTRYAADLPATWSRSLPLTTIALDDALPEQAQALLQQKLGTTKLPPLLEERLGLRDQQGRLSPVNPVFLEESLHMMQTAGVLSTETAVDGSRRVVVDEKALLAVQVPDSVYGMLLSRLDQLSTAARNLIQVASVIGRSFELETLVAIMPGMTMMQAMTLLQELEESEMVQVDMQVLDNAYIFQHALAHDVVYQSLPYARRQAIHASIGERILAQHKENLAPYYPLLAYHFHRTDRHEAGLRYSQAAAAAAAARFANKDAADLYQQAIEHLAGLDQARYWETAVVVHQARARVLRLMGHFSQATLAATEALKLCLLYGQIEDTLPVYNLMAELRYYQARFADTQQLTDKVINNLSGFTPPAQLAHAYLLSGMAATALNQHETALNHLERAGEICASTGQVSQQVAVWQALAAVYYEQQQTELARQKAQEAVSLALKNNLSAQLGVSLFALSRVHLRLGEARDAYDAIMEALDGMRTVSANWFAHMLAHKAAVLIYMGRWKQAKADLRRVVELLEAMDDPVGLLRVRLLWGYEYARASREWAEAHEQLVQVGKLVAAQPEESEMYVPEAARLWLGLAQVALQSDQAEQVDGLVQKALQFIEAQGLAWWRPAALYLQGLLYREWDAARAQERFAEGITAVAQGGCPDELPLLLWQLALLTDDEAHKWSLLEASVAAAYQRARYHDKLACYRAIGPMLLQADSPRLRRMGGMCLAFVEASQSV